MIINSIKKINLKGKQNAQLIFLFISALFATFIWVYYLSRGFTQPGILDAFIDIQAYVLQKGRLSITPDFETFFYHDISLYEGNYYFYWGILPALLHSLLSIMVGNTISSYSITFLFLFLFVYFFQRILFEIMNTPVRESSNHRWLTVPVTIILSWMLIFNLPFPYDAYKYSWFFGRFIIYEQQIIFGLGLAMPGIFFLIMGFKKYSPLFIIMATCFFAGAAWVRGTWFVFSILAIPIILGVLITKDRFRTSLKKTHYAFMMVPVLSLGGLLILNFVRFGNLLDFGLKLQIPMSYTYLRIQNGLFSPMTNLYNTIFKILEYYTSPDLINLLGLAEKSASWVEHTPPHFFYNNPILLLLTPIALYGIYRAIRLNKNTRNIVISIGLTALVINIVIACAGNVVTMRYFIECYYLTILFLFAGLTAALSVKISFPILFLLFSIYLPGNVKAFMENRLELRLIQVVEDKQNRVDYQIISQTDTGSVFQTETNLIYKDVRWHEGIVSTSQKELFTKHNTIAMLPWHDGRIYAWDLAAVYIKPQGMKRLSDQKALLEFTGIKSISKPGRIKVYLEQTKVAEFIIKHWEPRTYQAEINYNFKDNAPRRLLVYFFEGNEPYLPAKQSTLPSYSLEAIKLSLR